MQALKETEIRIMNPSSEATVIEQLSSPRREDVEESAEQRDKPPKSLYSLIDHFEVMVDHLKQQALQLEQEREFLLASLESFMNGSMLTELNNDERKAVDDQLNHIIDDCMAVNVKVTTSRSTKEEEALDRVNVYINNLIVNVAKDPAIARQECIDAIKSALPGKPEDVANGGSPFGTIHSCCTMDDQRRTIRRLRGLMSYIQTLQKEAVEMLE